MFLPEGIARYYRNDTLVKEIQYSVYRKKVFDFQTEKEIIQFNIDAIPRPVDYIDKIITYKGADTLWLSDYAADAYEYFYVRIRWSPVSLW